MLCYSFLFICSCALMAQFALIRAGKLLPIAPAEVILQPSIPSLDMSAPDVQHVQFFRHGTTGPVHTYIKTDKNAYFKWGVRHFVGNKYH